VAEGVAPLPSRLLPRVVEGRQGQYAGAVSRLLAFAVDVGASWLLFTLGLAVLSVATQLVTGRRFSLSAWQLVDLGVLVVWEFVYFSYQWSLAGKTIGMALFGIQVVEADGSPVRSRSAFLRTLFFPISIVTFGLGFIGILVGRDRRALHDRLAHTAVVYAWDARAARLRWLARQDSAPPAGPIP